MFGPDKKLENNPEHILNICNKIDVEVDAWFIDNKWFLGHDEPQYEVKKSFFNDKMWIHCKNLDALYFCQNTNLNYFWHEEDTCTITSKGFMWTYPGKEKNIYSNEVVLTAPIATTPAFTQVASICSGGSFTLPTTSNNGITGTWSPAINNTATTTYTFTPTAGQCATTATMSVTITAPTLSLLA